MDRIYLFFLKLTSVGAIASSFFNLFQYRSEIHIDYQVINIVK